MAKLLIMTTGQTDVQLVINGVRKELDAKTCGKLHDEIEKRRWTVVDAPAQKDHQCASNLPDGDVILCTPKLDAVLKYFGTELPSAALLLETRRTIDSDPRYAGAVLEKRLRDKGVSKVQRHAFLEDQETLEDQTNDADAVVRGSVVLSLSQAIASAVEQVKSKEIIVATTGGLAAANAVIEELARLYAEANEATVKVLEVPDAAIANQIDRAVEEKFHPAAGIRARWQALSLIQKGNLLAAWGAVSHLENQPGQEWTKVVRWLADFAASLPLAKECDIEVLKHPKMAVRAALRVELALRAGDVPRAVHGTVAFFESALWDHLLEHFERTGNKQRGLDKLRLKEGAPAPLGEKLLRNNVTDEGEKRKCPFEHLDDGTYLFFEDGAGRFAKYYVNSKPLKKLVDPIGNVKHLRNDVAHNEPTPELMQHAHDEMQGAKLWSEDDPPQFLKQPLVQGVLEELGVEEPNLLCEKLLETVRARLLLTPQPSSDARQEEA
ncbi:MAG: hypothetical protein KatS3mg015_3068 [Fimbriimonadales bacterium]|nr:MAG: hypothetical protein KatS3mg015_3068 [Fimbriimonadales bacterium]